MKKIVLLLLGIGFVALIGWFVFSQYGGKKQMDKVYHVGILSGLNLFSSIVDSFKDEMNTLGYIEGKNIVYDLQKTNFEPEKEKAILEKFVSDKVDLIFGFNTEVALEAKEAVRGTDIPVVFANAFTEGNNLIESVRAPGGNITGVRYPNTDVAVKRLEVLHEIVPGAKRFWLPYQKGYPSAPAELDVVRPAAKRLGVTLIEFPAENVTTLETELAKRAQSADLGFDAVLFIPESLSTTKAEFEVIAKYTRNRKIPIGGSSVATDDKYSPVFAVTISNAEIGKLAARTTDKILRGIKAGTIPVASPEQYLRLYYNVAQELGLTFSSGLMGRANEVVR
jgi:putative tryptophan/tyrosine transport system substrate-binding protein